MSGVLSFADQNNKWNTAGEAAAVVQAINEAKEVKCLKLEANTLGVEAAEAIGDALANHPEFERAHWKDLFTGRLKNEIPKALKYLFSGLIRAKAKLIELDLSDNALGPVGVEGMTDFMKSPTCYSLQELRLNNNGLGIKGGTMLANALKELVYSAKENGTPLQLKVFIVGRNRLEKEGARVYAELLSSIGTLEVIQMPQNGIFKEGIAALAKACSENPNLKHINLNDNTFTPEGAASMAEYLPLMQNLEIINFGDCLLKTSGAQFIAQAILENHCKLKELHLDSNEIRVNGALDIIDAIASNKGDFQHLLLDANQFGERIDEIYMRLDEYNLSHVLGPLEDDMDPDSDEDDEDDFSGGEEGESGGEEEDVDSEEIEQEGEEDDDYTTEEEEVIGDFGENFSGISPLKRGGLTPGNKVSTIMCTPSEFFQKPSSSKLLQLPLPEIELVEEVFQICHSLNPEEIVGMPTSSMTLIDEFMKALVIVSQYGDTTDRALLDRVHTCSSSLARAAFECASKADILYVATNSLLVYFGLVKSEDKNFSIDWNLNGCLKSMCYVVTESFFPKETRTTLQLFLSKSHKHVDMYLDSKHKLLSALYKI